jgi:aspartate aminotransferase-like enzyme
MGFGSNKKNVLLCLSAIGNALRVQGRQLDLPAALESAESVYQD